MISVKLLDRDASRFDSLDLELLEFKGRQSHLGLLCRCILGGRLAKAFISTDVRAAGWLNQTFIYMVIIFVNMG